MPVAVVTDSTAYLAEDLITGWGITVVPVQVVIGGRSVAEGAGVTPAAVAAALRDRRPVTTSRPSPERFLAAYRSAAEAGAHAVVSVHLSGEMSGTVDSARLAAAAAPVPVHVVDSRSVGMGLGYAVIRAAELARSGASGDQVADGARLRAEASSAFFYVDTVEYLRRGGRISAAAAVVGSALAVKPLLELVDGRIGLLEKVRTASRAVARLEDVAVERAGQVQVDMAVHHLAAVARAEQLAARLRTRVPGLRDLRVSEVGAVVGAHVGPGMLAVAVAPV